jgi:hypothetical protein
MTPFLLNPAIKPGFDAILHAHLYFKDILRIRKSSPLFRLQTGEEVKRCLKFYNVGPGQQPALIVMMLSDKTGPALDFHAQTIVVLFNVDRIPKTVTVPDCVGMPLDLHSVHSQIALFSNPNTIRGPAPLSFLREQLRCLLKNVRRSFPGKARVLAFLSVEA